MNATTQDDPLKLQVSETTRTLLSQSRTTVELVKELERTDLCGDAVRVLSYQLPGRQAIWWGCLCVWHRYRPKPPPKEEQALKAVVDWIRSPSEERRRSAEAAGNRAGVDTAAGLLALGVFCTGSMAPPGAQNVEPVPDLSARMVANAVLHASWRCPHEREQDLRQFLAMGIDVAAGRSSWMPSPEPAHS